MARYRNIHVSFWTDSKIMDEFTPEDRYFYLYLFTNPHTNLCGCYEISIRHMVNEVGYSRESIENLLKRFECVHKVISYSYETKEVLLIKWPKYNWTSSEKFRKPLLKEINNIKKAGYRDYLLSVYEADDTVSIRYTYPIDTTVTVTDTVSDTVPVTVNSYSNNTIYINGNIVEKREVEEFFELIWSMYIKKRGKGNVSFKQKCKLYEIGFDQIARCIERYKLEVRGKDEKYIKMGSTFFNSGYIDYLDENYVPPRDTSNDAILAFLNAEDD